MVDLLKDEHKYCMRCHRELKDIESKKLGFGKICYSKYIKKKPIYLFEMGGNNEITRKE